MLARPAVSDGPGSSAVVLLHGGGGRAEPRWARSWAARGHTALALDLGAPRAVAGEARPARLDHAGIFDAVAQGTGHSWLHQAVEACVDAVTFVRSLPGVDPRAVGVCGVSWGGYVALLLASADPRLRYAVDVYAAGFLARDSAWSALLRDLPAATARRWTAAFDLARHVHRVTAPTLWLTGTGDPCFPLDAFDATAGLARGPVTRRIVPGLEHDHEAAWRLTEPYAFAAAALGGGPALPALRAARVVGGHLRAEVESATPVLHAALHHTRDTGPWTTRRWRSTVAVIDGATVRADVPADGFSAAFLSARTATGTSTTGLLTGRAAETGRRPKGDPLWCVARNRTW
ncbi:alpha/beta hydrolase family protein [Jiangella asiatica]|uniref:alpha/beta hydrolase family protein n=1 Tax=Jiangella asiatica TaxID=2530372 RepID=UPI0013A5E29C|nr:dienelactone hydrolase family protein [Jiangella asiatica]